MRLEAENLQLSFPLFHSHIEQIIQNVLHSDWSIEPEGIYRLFRDVNAYQKKTIGFSFAEFLAYFKHKSGWPVTEVNGICCNTFKLIAAGLLKFKH